MNIVHVGGGTTIIPNAVNIDYIRVYKYVKFPLFGKILVRLNLLNKKTFDELCPFRDFCRYGKATKLPVESEWADVVYSCHMMEHLTYTNAELFLDEVYRVLKKDGVFRLVLPDLSFYIQRYVKNQDADQFMNGTLLTFDNAAISLKDRLVNFYYGKGISKHEYMYDALSASKLLECHGFHDIMVLAAGESTLPMIEGIDLKARERDSFYLECRK